MKISIISDSHDNIDNLKKAIEISNNEKCEYLIHLGDIVSPFSAKILKEFNGLVKAVFGNNDGEVLGLKQIFNTFGGEIENSPCKFELGGKKFVIMHEPYFLEELAESQEFDYIFYGHLHKTDYKNIKRTYILNPGELGGWIDKPTFYILETKSNDFKEYKV